MVWFSDPPSIHCTEYSEVLFGKLAEHQLTVSWLSTKAGEVSICRRLQRLLWQRVWTTNTPGLVTHLHLIE